MTKGEREIIMLEKRVGENNLTIARLACELGFRAHEKGQNLQWALREVSRILKKGERE